MSPPNEYGISHDGGARLKLKATRRGRRKLHRRIKLSRKAFSKKGGFRKRVIEFGASLIMPFVASFL